MKTLKEGIEFLLDKYAVDKKVEILSHSEVKINGENSALLPWRWERRITELKNLAQGTAASGALKNVSVMRSSHIANKGTDIFKVLKREIDICEYVTGSRVAEIFAVGDENSVINVIAKLKSGVICTIELAATLCPSTKIVDKHEVIAEQGVACDRVVDTQVPQSTTYVFTDSENPTGYQDVDAELYGLSIDEIAVVRQCFDMAANEYSLNEDNTHLNGLIDAAKTSLKEVRNVIV